MMKTIQLITLTATLALAAGGKDNIPDTPADYGELKIVASIAASPDADVLPTGRSADTRATIDPDDGSGTFATGDKLRLQVRGSIPVSFHTGYTIGTTVLRWKDFDLIGNEGPLGFSGAYPENAVDNNNCFYILRGDNPANPDLLIAPTVTVAKGEPVHLAFRHVMHRLVVNLSGNALTADELSQATVQLSKSLYCCAVVDFTNATAFTDNSAIYGDNPLTRTGATTTFILVPQNISSYSEKITITAGGQELTYTFPATLPGNEGTLDTPRRLQSGRTLTLNLAINTANRSAAASAKPSTRATTTDDAALTLECTGITVSAW